MKAIISIITLLFLSIAFFSCTDFLEEPKDVAGLTEDVVFSTIEDAEKVLAAAYSCPPWGFPTYEAGGAWSYGILNYFAPIAALSDEADVATKAVDFLHTRYHLGTLSADEIYPFTEDKWDMNWQVIRSGWLFYDNVDKVKDGTSKEYINRRKCEALGMIATKYYEMFKRYGGIPWVNHYLKVGEKESKTRLSVTATCDSICSLIDRAMEYLPNRNDPGEFGRINKVAMMTLKARTLLVSASPLFNPEDNASYYPIFGAQSLLKHDSYDKERWKKAADAAKLAIETAHSAGYALYNDPQKSPSENYKLSFTAFPEMKKDENGNLSAGNNKEIIWGTRVYPSYSYMEGSYRCRIYSKSNFVSGTAYCIPLQNFVDLYELKDGSVQPANFYSQKDPYSKLDARFDVTMFYHGKKAGTYILDMSPGGDNNPPSNGIAQNFTGYYLSKFFDASWVVGQAGAPESYWPYMRLAELYLIYAEALTEYDYNANKIEVLKYINLIRNRAGQPNLENSPQFADNQSYVREHVRNERAVELAFEEQRYFDLKRWKMGPDNIGGQMYGMSIGGTAKDPTFTKVTFEERVFTDKWYLYPIKKADIQLCNGELIQNPGW
jgi:starch-binding outer membrane protein, SusD/RagB family